ncbi:DUF4157 domain-containing protein [Streptomyces sp. NPDC021098]|uniref:eCIS core domain-containing protein n=1 Tax=unclassified Streptomyces TaxID=2593676 RepID=UPI0037A8638E
MHARDTGKTPATAPHTPAPSTVHSTAPETGSHAGPGAGSAPSLLALQRAAGNAAAVRSVQRAQQAGEQAGEQHRHGPGCGHRPVQRSAVPEVLGSGGTSLDEPVRHEMESRLGADFSDVRLHTGSAARASAAEFGARAYTSGNHVVIGDGGADKHTLAHELTHVIQQRQGPVAGTDNGSGLKVSDPSDRFEREAEANASRAMAGPVPRATAPAEPAGHHGTAHSADIQRAPGNLATDRPGAREATADRAAQNQLVQNPEEFLNRSALALDFMLGIKERTPELPLDVNGFVERMDNRARHWFVLVPDRRRARKDRPAYLLTPAVEKYVEESDGSDRLLSPLVGHPALPAVLPSNGYLASSYVPYFQGVSKAPDTRVGHTDIPHDAGAQGHGSEFVFTATMNGCAFAVTGSAQRGHFTAWHYQSPSSISNQPPAREFRRDRAPTDWFGPEEYKSTVQNGIFETTNMLWNGPDSWEVLSQETHVNRHDMGDAQIKSVRRRPLRMAAGGEAQYTARIYAGLARDQLEDLMRKLTYARDNSGEQAAELEKNVFKPLEIAMAREPLELKDLDSFAALSEVALMLKHQRFEVLDRARDWIEAHFTAARGGMLALLDNAESLRKRQKGVSDLIAEFSKWGWLAGLLEEAADHPAAPATGAGPGDHARR